MLTAQGFTDGPSDEDESIDSDIPNTHRRTSFVGVRNSQEVIATHLDKTFENQLRHAVGALFFGAWHMRLAFSMLVSLVLCAVCCSSRQPERGEDWLELGVICLAYGTWFVFCGPMLMATLNLRMLTQVMHMLLRVFFADMAVMAYAFYRGHNNVLRRGFGLFPTLEANRPGQGLAWLGEAGYYLRLASLLSCFLIALIITAMDAWTTRSLGLM